jgi:hypothetical protein
MAFINIQLTPNHVLDPMLQKLVDKLALDMPAYTFGTRGAKDIRNYDSPVGLVNNVSRVLPPEGFRFLRKVRVYSGSEFLGKVGIDEEYRRRGEKFVYTISSWRINKSRGNSNESRTSSLTGAARIAKKVFVQRSTDEIMTKAVAALSTGLYAAARDFVRVIDHNQMAPSAVHLQQYVFKLLRKDSIPPELEQEMRDKFLSEKYEKAMAEYHLAQKMGDAKYTAAVQHENGFLIRDSKGVGDYTEFKELPEHMQNAIGVLQLMEDCELVNDIGFRLNDRNFLILEK